MAVYTMSIGLWRCWKEGRPRVVSNQYQVVFAAIGRKRGYPESKGKNLTQRSSTRKRHYALSRSRKDAKREKIIEQEVTEGKSESPPSFLSAVRQSFRGCKSYGGCTLKTRKCAKVDRFVDRRIRIINC